MPTTRARSAASASPEPGDDNQSTHTRTEAQIGAHGWFTRDSPPPFIPPSPASTNSFAPSGDSDDEAQVPSSPPKSPEQKPAEKQKPIIKRKRAISVPEPCSKRLRLGKKVYNAYLNILNTDIQDAAALSSLNFTAISTDPLSSGPGARVVKKLQPSQLGAVMWSADHKALFFAALSRFGKARLDLVAKATGKSVPEVMQYLNLLRRESERREEIAHNRNKMPRPLKHEGGDESATATEDEAGGDGRGVEAVEAAVEISADLDGRLDDLAERLEDKVWRRDCRAEEERWGKDWLVDWDAAVRIKEELEEGLADMAHREKTSVPGRKRRKGGDMETESDESDESDDNNATTTAKQVDDINNPDSSPSSHQTEAHDKLLHASELLNPLSLLTLQLRFFMNPGPSHFSEHWYQYRTDSIPAPAIFATALTDFASLVKIVTEKLVAASLFQANARLRSVDQSRWKRVRKLVVAEDVQAALGVLRWKEGVLRGKEVERHGDSGGMASLNAQERSLWEEYWQGLPRRLKLRVYDLNLRRDREWLISWKIRKSQMKLGKPLPYDELEKRLGNGSDTATDNKDLTAEAQLGMPAVPPLDLQALALGADAAREDDENEDSASTASSSSSNSHFSDGDQPEIDQNIVPSTPHHQMISVASTAMSTADPSPDSRHSSNSNESPSNPASDTDTPTDASLNSQDLYNSQLEEIRLWRLLTLQHPPDLLGHTRQEAPASFMPMQYQGRPGNNEPISRSLGTRVEAKLEDWRDWCDWRAEWERYG